MRRYVDEQIYGDRVNAGWGYRPFGQQYDNFWAQEAGMHGSNATCLSTSQNGGIGFTCREVMRISMHACMLYLCSTAGQGRNSKGRVACAAV